MTDSQKRGDELSVGSYTESLQMSRREVAESQSFSADSLTPVDSTSPTVERLQAALHELQVHQIELEMQNEELRLAQINLDAARLRYFDLYEFAPVAYLTIGEHDVIKEANLTANMLLGTAGGALTNRSFRSFINDADQDIFYFHRKLLKDLGKPQTCELQLKRGDGSRIWVRLVTKPVASATSSSVLRIAMSDVTEFKQAEFARIESQQRFGYVLEATQDGIWDWNMNTDHVYFSPQWARLLGYDPAEIQEHVSTFYALVHPDDLTFFRQQPGPRSSGNTNEKTCEIRLRTKSGEYRWFLDRGKIVSRDATGAPTRMVGSITDITERKRAEILRSQIEARLREREGRLRKAQTISKTGDFYWNSHTKSYELSDELHRLFGLGSNKSTARVAAMLLAIHPHDRASVIQLLRKAMLSRHELNHELRVVRPDGSVVWLHALVSAITDDYGRPAGLEGTCQDITERRNAEAERDSLQAQLREAQKMQAVGTLAGGIAHDFNNILAIILGNVAIASQSTMHEALLRLCIDEIRKAGMRGRELVQQILSFSRQQPTRLRPLSLASVIEESASLLKSTLPARLTLDVKCTDDLPQVFGDKTQLEQVILNLATNSMQAIGENSGTIRIETDSVLLDENLAESHPALKEMRNQSQSTVLRLMISDDGPGMNSATAERIFEPFFTTKPVGVGTGLGLSVVHGIITAHKGCITVETEESRGTLFTIYLLPVASVDKSTVSPEVKETRLNSSRPIELEPQIFHIILIDDNEAVLQATKRLLTIRGYRVTAFTDSRKALHALRNDPCAFDLLITDYNLPAMSGLGISRAAREIRPDIPIAVASGFIDEELRNKSAQAGVLELIPKPFIVDEFLAAVRRLLTVSVATGHSGRSLQ